MRESTRSGLTHQVLLLHITKFNSSIVSGLFKYRGGGRGGNQRKKNKLQISNSSRRINSSTNDSAPVWIRDYCVCECIRWQKAFSHILRTFTHSVSTHLWKVHRCLLVWMQYGIVVCVCVCGYANSVTTDKRKNERKKQTRKKFTRVACQCSYYRADSKSRLIEHVRTWSCECTTLSPECVHLWDSILSVTHTHTRCGHASCVKMVQRKIR